MVSRYFPFAASKSMILIFGWVFGVFSSQRAGSKHMNSTTGADPMHLTTCRPFQSSHTSFDVDDMSSASAAARFSLALPTSALSHEGPPTRIALTMMVITPSGAMARTMLSAQPIDWLMNCIVTLSPKSASTLATIDR